MYCADIGSVARGHFGWARSEEQGEVRSRHGGTEIVDLVEAVAADLGGGRAVALGFECPLFVPVTEQPLRLGAARAGEGNRSWSAGAGAGSLVTGLVQVTWVLSELHKRVPAAPFYLEWPTFEGAGSGLLLWEAFVTDQAKGDSHVDDATIAALAFREQIRAQSAVSAERPLSLVGVALLWGGWSTDLSLLHSVCVVIKPPPPPITLTDVVSDSPAEPRARPDQRRRNARS